MRRFLTFPIRISSAWLLVFLLNFGTVTVVTLKSAVADSQPSMFAVIDQYADFAAAAYGDKQAMQLASQKHHYTLTDYGQLDGLEIRYFLATNTKNKTQLISVRGTANLENAIVDIALQLTADNPVGIRLHNGFAQSALGVFQQIKPKLKRDYTINTTGHSLGGAVAVVLAMYLDKDNYNIDKVISFGQPKVTNLAGTKIYDHLSILRIVTPKDVVPLLPPLDPSDIDNLDIYWHLGTEIVLLGGNQYSMLSGMKSMLRTVNFLNDQPSEENIHNHDMVLYKRLVNQKLKAATLIPYKTDFSFVGDVLKLFK